MVRHSHLALVALRRINGGGKVTVISTKQNCGCCDPLTMDLERTSASPKPGARKRYGPCGALTVVVSSTFPIVRMRVIRTERKIFGSALQDAPTSAAFQTSPTAACFGP